jgi:metal-responsive CopG/Arc/MetJ family transcriptional regulator
MKNITISMDDDLARHIRIAAAKAGVSVSRYLAEAGREKVRSDETAAKRNRQEEALEKIFSGPKWDVTENGRMPSAEERNARR